MSYNMAKGKRFEPKGHFGRDRAKTLVETGIEKARTAR